MGLIMAAKQQDEALEIDNWEEIEETDVRILFIPLHMLP